MFCEDSKVQHYALSAVALVTAVKAVTVWPSVTATLLNDHVLVMAQGQIIVLVVQHGERAEARWHAGRAGPSFWMVMSQEALKSTGIIHMNKPATIRTHVIV